MLNVGNVATPETAFTCAAPVSVPLDGLVAIAIVLWVVAVGTTLPWASSMFTATAGVIELPATILVGCCVNASFAAAPAVTLNALLVTLSDPATAVSV